MSHRAARRSPCRPGADVNRLGDVNSAGNLALCSADQSTRARLTGSAQLGPPVVPSRAPRSRLGRRALACAARSVTRLTARRASILRNLRETEEGFYVTPLAAVGRGHSQPASKQGRSSKTERARPRQPSRVSPWRGYGAHRSDQVGESATIRACPRRTAPSGLTTRSFRSARAAVSSRSAPWVRRARSGRSPRSVLCAQWRRRWRGARLSQRPGPGSFLEIERGGRGSWPGRSSPRRAPPSRSARLENRLEVDSRRTDPRRTSARTAGVRTTPSRLAIVPSSEPPTPARGAVVEAQAQVGNHRRSAAGRSASANRGARASPPSPRRRARREMCSLRSVSNRAAARCCRSR
jgi:hypothetical protein